MREASPHQRLHGAMQGMTYLSTDERCERERRALLVLLHDAFGSSMPPSAEATTADPMDEVGEYSYVKRFYRGRQWSTIRPDELLDRYPGDLSASIAFMSSIGWLHYLPLLISTVLQEPRRSGVLVDSVVRALTPEKNRRMQFELEYGQLDSVQRTAISRFLEYLAACRPDDYLKEEHEEPGSPHYALSAFWAKQSAP